MDGHEIKERGIFDTPLVHHTRHSLYVFGFFQDSIVLLKNVATESNI